jgi:hypothetical protein
MYMPVGEHDPSRHPPAAAQAQKEAERAEEEELRALDAQLTEQADVKKRKLSNSPQPSSLYPLARALRRQNWKAVFTCGGRIPIIMEPHRTEAGCLTPQTRGKVERQTHLASPVTIRWDGDGRGRVLSLPTTDAASEATCQQLIDSCMPATFGRDGQDVYDESYRTVNRQYIRGREEGRSNNPAN